MRTRPPELVCLVSHRSGQSPQGRGAEEEKLPAGRWFHSAAPVVQAQHLKVHNFCNTGKSSMSEPFLNSLMTGRYPEMTPFGLRLMTDNKGKY